MSNAALKIHPGYTLRFKGVYTADGVAVNLTGKAVRFGLKIHAAADSYFEIDSANSPTANGSRMTITDAVNGKFEAKITAADTNVLAPARNHTWVLAFTEGNDIDLIGFGPLTIERI